MRAGNLLCGSVYRKVLFTSCLVPLVWVHSALAADKQVVTSSPSSVEIAKGSTDNFTIEATYDTDPSGSTTTGLGIGIFFDSSKISFVSMSNAHTKSVFLMHEAPEDIQSDASNDDSDESTDYVALITWADLTGDDDFTAPSDLFTVTFKPATSDFEGTTSINYSKFSAAAGYEVSAEPSSITVTFAGDTVDPTISAPSSISVEAEGSDGTPASNTEIVAFLTGGTASDNLDGDISSAITTDASSTFPLGETTVTFTTTDSSNNTVTATAAVTVSDTTGPIVVAPENITVAAVDATGTPATDTTITTFLTAAVATDTVSGAVTVTTDAPETFPLGATTVTFSASDGTGNAGSSSATVTVSDTTGPVLTLTDTTIEATSASGATPDAATLLSGASASDNVDGSVAVTSSDSGSTFALGTSTVHVASEDAAGNTSTGTFTLTVSDTSGPVISGTDLTVNLDPDETISTSHETITSWIAGVTATDAVDGTVSISNDLAEATLSESSTTVSFSATDSLGNETTQTYVLKVAYGPSVTAPTAISFVSVDSSAVSADSSIITAFLNGASATDSDNASLTVSNDAPESFAVGITTVTFSAVDAESKTGTATSTVTILAPSTDNDTDGDGINDAYEVANSLDPNDESDGATDADGDGLTNLEEYLAGTDPNIDSVAPVVTAPTDVQVVSEGVLTDVSLGAASATDALDGDISVSVSNSGPYPVGTTEITWTALDAAGNTGSAVQTVVVLPYAETLSLGRVAEGNNFDLKAFLNSAAPSYPVEIPVSFTGTATEGTDYSSAAATIVIESGTEGSVVITVAADAELEGDETIVATLDTPASGAGLGPNKVASITIIEASVPPALRLDVSQGDNSGRSVATDAGQVTVSLTITDPNGSHTTDWSETDPNLVADDGLTGTSFIFDPTSVTAGNYKVIVSVTDSEIFTETYKTSVVLNVVATDAKADSDGDGVSDDNDQYTASNVVALDASVTSAPAATDSGLKLVVGDAAAASGKEGLQVDESTIVSGGDDGTGAVENGNDEEYGYPAGVFDFTVQDLPVPGQSVNVVIPITTGIPANAIYRKYEATTGWYTFVSDDDNYVSSAAGTSESCPAASSTVYEQGLTQGDFCVQLTIKDGGENDADGTANGIVDDPGGVAVDDNAPTLVPPADITVTATSGSGISSSDSSLASFFAGASATDSADDDVTITNDAPASLPVGTVTVTFTATDDSGNSATATAVVTVDSMKKGSESSWLGCSMGSGKGPVDPMLPMLLIATLVGIFRRKFAFLR